MRALVTGGAGFIGHHLCAALAAQNVEVIAIDDLSTGRPDLLNDIQGSFRLAPLDVRKQHEVAALVARVQPHWVFHLAALHFIPACNRDRVATLDINTLGTASILEAARACGSVERLVFASTAAVYPPDQAISSESDAPGPDDIYGQSKLFAEHLIQNFSRETQIGTAMLRLFNVYGPGETNPHVIPEIMEQARSSDTIRLGNLSPRRDYVYVDDVVDAFLRAARSDAPPSIVNVGTGRAHSVSDLISVLSTVLQRQLRVACDPERLRPSDRPTLCADNTLARSALGWTPRFDLEAGLRATWASLEPMTVLPA
jgi:UDP-glucose 4-epimerase